MPTWTRRIYCLCFLLIIYNICTAQKDIVISDSLAANAAKLNVKMGAQWFGKIWKFRFGEYAVVSSKLGWGSTTTKGNLFNTKTESKSTEKFSFLLTNGTNDSAKVNAANNISTQSLHEMEILPNFSWGNNEILQESRNFSAFISLNHDTSETWVLLMNITRGSNTRGKYDVQLTNGERKIVVIPTTSNKNGVADTRSLPALGYEFIENGQSLAALQYYGGGALGMNKNIVWLHNSLDAKIKLILAAAGTAILQIKANSSQEQL